jgi:crotonobetainyl-CoA:carnitine CoA-transferase CaiB-like acyl-CoA transferase
VKPLKGLLVIDFSQFLSGPSAAPRLVDLGARVIKIERPDGGQPPQGVTLKTTRCPIRIDSEILKSSVGTPAIGQHTEEIIREFAL